MEVVTSESVESNAPSENPPSSVGPVLRRFLDEGCGLHARIRQLSADLPPAFTETKTEFSPVLPDFKFLKDAENENLKLMRSNFLKNLYNRSRLELSEICRQAFDLFYQVIQFHKRVYDMVEDIESRKYVQDSLESVAQDQESLPMLIELLYMVGAILLLLDRCLPGLTRERLVVAHVRHNNCLDLILKDDRLQKLCKKTGYMPGTKLPQGYPQTYLINFPIPEKVVRFLLALLLQTDVYGTLKHYPNPAHRTTALSRQAAYTFVLLYFVPEVLNKDSELMNQVVERLFSDRWVIAWLCGYTANLRFEWDGYRAAKNALKNVLSRGKRGKISQQHWEKVNALSVELERNLKTGNLQTETFLRHNSDTFSLVREANVTLRWVLLHAFSGSWIPDPVDGENIARLLLNLATLELEMFRIYQQLIDSRQDRIESACSLVKDSLKYKYKPMDFSTWTLACRCLIEMNDPGQKQPPSPNQDSHLIYWLKCLSAEVDALGSITSSEAGEKARSVQRTFDEIVNFGQLDNSTTNSRKLVSEVRSNLIVIQHLMNIRQEITDTLKMASDFSYACHLWQHEGFIKLIQSLVRQEPANLEKVGSLLMKMRSVLQDSSGNVDHDSDDTVLSKLDKYYASLLRSFGEKVFNHVPECVCNALDQMTIIRTHTQKLRRNRGSEAPSIRFGLVVKPSENRHKGVDDTSKHYGKLANLAAEIALFSTGLTKVEACLGSMIPLRLRDDLEEKVRQHIAKRISSLANQKLQFGLAAPPFTFQNVTLKGSRQIAMGQAFSGVVGGRSEFDTRVTELKEYLDGLLHSLECTQDCLGLPGGELWHGEMAHVVAINLRREYKWMVKGKTGRVGSKRQGVTDLDSACTFLGRLAREIARLTSPGTTHYSVQGCWLDATGTEVFGVSSMAEIRQSISVQGLAALDTLLATRVVKLIKKLHDLCTELCTLQTSGQKAISTYARELQSCMGLSVPIDGAMWYVDAVYSVGSRVWSPIIEIVAAIGQSQLLRKLVALECRNVSLLEAPVAFHRTMKLLSDFVEDKDADFSSCPESADRISRRTTSTTARDSASIASGSTFAGQGNKSEDDELPNRSGQNHPRHPATIRDQPGPSKGIAVPEDTAIEEESAGLFEGESSQISDVELPDSAFVQYDKELGTEGPSQLGTITEVSPKNDRDPSLGTHSIKNESSAVGSPNLSSSSVRLSDIIRGDRANKASPQMFEGPVSLGSAASRTRKKFIYTHNSEASSSGLSDPVWMATFPRRKPKQATSDTSGFHVLPSEASSRHLFLSSVDLSMLGAESSCDLFNSLSSNASAPVLHGAGTEGVFRMLQSTGFLNPMETRYISEHPPITEVPIILFLATVSIVHKYEFNKQSASLMRPLGSTIPDAKSFATGLVTILYQYVPSITDQFLRHVGQYVRAYLKTATGATAQGIAAAGVKMVLPQEVQRTVAFVCEMCEVGGWSRKRAERFIPPFLLDVWMLGV